MSKAAHFALVTAFTTNLYAGNPAAIVFLDPHLPLDVLGKIAGNFNQPVTSIVSPTSDASDNDKTITRHIRYVVSNGKEINICGHGTLAAAKVLFTQLGPGEENVDTIHFRCVSGARLVAIKREDGFIEIELPSGVLVKVSGEEETRLTSFVNKAFGREVLIKSIRRGGPGVYHYCNYSDIFNGCQMLTR
jgi:PhzF family phenazine biosynthesis protein